MDRQSSSSSSSNSNHHHHHHSHHSHHSSHHHSYTQLPPLHLPPPSSFRSSSHLPPLSPGRYPPPTYHPSISPPPHPLPWPLRRNQHDMKPPLPPPPPPPPPLHHHSHHSHHNTAPPPRSSSSSHPPPPTPTPQSKPIDPKDTDDGMPPTSDFVKKLYKMLQDNNFHDIVSWTPPGDSFVIKDITEFTKSILPRMFKHSNFASFVRQLNKYDFHKVKNSDHPDSLLNSYGDHAWTFKHPDFQANNRDALENIKRKVPSQRKTAKSTPAATAAAPTVPSTPANNNNNTTTAQAPSPASPTTTTPGPAPQQQQPPYSLTEDPLIQSMQSQIEHLNRSVQDLTSHIRNMEQNYQSVLDEMVNFQRNMAQQDGLLQNLIQYFLQIENGKKQAENPAASSTTAASSGSNAATATATNTNTVKTETTAGEEKSTNSVSTTTPSALENQFVPVSEAQRIMNGAYPETDIARASFEQMNEMARRANTAGMQFGTGWPALVVGTTTSPSPSPLSKQDALQRIEELSRTRSSSASPLPLSLSVLLANDQPQPQHYHEQQPIIPHLHNNANNYTMVTSSDTSRRNSAPLPLPTTTTSPKGESFPGLQVFTVGHLLPRSDNAPDDGTWSFDPTSLQINGLGLGLGFNGLNNNNAGSIQSASNTASSSSASSGLAMDVVDMDFPSSASSSSGNIPPTTATTTHATITSHHHPHPTSSLSTATATATTKTKTTSQRLRVRRSTFVPGWAVPPRVLLVEDDAVSRKLSTKFLQVFGCTTDIAIDGVAAVHKMNLEKYDLVLMDIVMPKLDGVSATSLIRQFDPMTPIISMTSNSNPSEILMYYSHGMNDILPKPFTRDGLFEMVEKHLMHLKSIQEMVCRPQSGMMIDPYNTYPRRGTITVVPDSNSKSNLITTGGEVPEEGGGGQSSSSGSGVATGRRRAGLRGGSRSRGGSNRPSGAGDGTGPPSPAYDDDEDEEEEEEEEDPNEVVPASRPPSDPLPPLPLQSLSLPGEASGAAAAETGGGGRPPTPQSSLPLQLFHPQPPMASTDARINPLAGFRLSDEQYAVILQGIVSAGDFGAGGEGDGGEMRSAENNNGVTARISEVGVSNSVSMPLDVSSSSASSSSSSGPGAHIHRHSHSHPHSHAHPHWSGLGNMSAISSVGGGGIGMVDIGGGGGTGAGGGVNMHARIEDVEDNTSAGGRLYNNGASTSGSAPGSAPGSGSGSGSGSGQVLGKRRERERGREDDDGAAEGYGDEEDDNTEGGAVSNGSKMKLKPGGGNTIPGGNELAGGESNTNATTVKNSRVGNVGVGVGVGASGSANKRGRYE